MRSFLSLVGYYRRFVEWFPSIDSLLTRLTQKIVKYQWSNDSEKNFAELKTILTIDHVLVLPKGSDNYMIYCDASRVFLGCVLMETYKVISYALENLRWLRRTRQFMTSSLLQWCLHSRFGDITCMVFMWMCSLTKVKFSLEENYLSSFRIMIWVFITILLRRI